MDSTGSLAREETAYLAHHHELLVSLAPVGDSAMVQLEAWVEDKVIQFWPNFQKVRDGVTHQVRLTIAEPFS